MILTSQYSFAQKGQITGVIHEDPATPLPYAAITLKENTDIPIAAGISDDKGIFRLENIPAGTYTINYSLLGFETVSKTIQILSLIHI